MSALIGPLRAALLALILAPCVAGADDAIVLASTTSLQDSGLYDYLLPIFKGQTGILVKVVARGTGQALETASRGDADVVFVHAEAAERKFVADGDGLSRHPVMYDEFVIIGPKDDPAGIAGQTDILKVFQALASHHATFISRGDESGTHLAELAFWKDAGVDLDKVRGPWYRPIGQGMGAALNFASATGAYVLSDRSSWLNFGNKGDLRILMQGDPRLFNQYSVIQVNPKKHPQVRDAASARFVDYLLSPQGQMDIGRYRIGGEQVFHPDAAGVPR